VAPEDAGKKNWAVVRRMVGYDRLESPALPALEYIHHLARDCINFLHPVRKLVSKTRTGPRVTRRYDIARTPFHRLLDSGVLSRTKTKQLQARSKQRDPLRLKVCSSRLRNAPLPLEPFGRILT